MNRTIVRKTLKDISMATLEFYTAKIDQQIGLEVGHFYLPEQIRAKGSTNVQSASSEVKHHSG